MVEIDEVLRIKLAEDFLAIYGKEFVKKINYVNYARSSGEVRIDYVSPTGDKYLERVCIFDFLAFVYSKLTKIKVSFE